MASTSAFHGTVTWRQNYTLIIISNWVCLVVYILSMWVMLNINNFPSQQHDSNLNNQLISPPTVSEALCFAYILWYIYTFCTPEIWETIYLSSNKAYVSLFSACRIFFSLWPTLLTKYVVAHVHNSFAVHHYKENQVFNTNKSWVCYCSVLYLSIYLDSLFTII